MEHAAPTATCPDCRDDAWLDALYDRHDALLCEVVDAVVGHYDDPAAYAVLWIHPSHAAYDRMRRDAPPRSLRTAGEDGFLSIIARIHLVKTLRDVGDHGTAALVARGTDGDSMLVVLVTKGDHYYTCAVDMDRCGVCEGCVAAQASRAARARAAN